ncbi:S49 family peptidase [Halosquirtibacter xylanolyticus]|uniref:NfeD family protein n=1 Tax=Halosquirtibacter xylanolyticus TaxID=3374599 RepID=UPI003747D073|nr:S49 family peptidase [Prolixibacteraceae bacterium]
MWNRVYQLLMIIVLCFCSHVGQASQKKILSYNLKDEINSVSWYDTRMAFEKAEEDSVDAILILMNTYGGRVKDADSIRSRILRSKIPVYVFVDNNAASAGAMISLACDSIYMTPGGSIGAATVVGMDGKAMPDKYQSYQRATMRATAEAKGKIVDGDGNEVWRRDPSIAEAMVDEDLQIEGVSEEGKVLTFTADEALKYRYCDAIVLSEQDLLLRLGYEKEQVISFELSAQDKYIRFFASPFLPTIIVTFLLIGLFSSFKMPGLFSPFLMIIGFGALFFIPLFLFGYATTWEVLIFMAGVVLLFLEIFIVPGFGFTGISGILCVVTSLVLAMVDNDTFNFEWVETDALSTALTIVLGALIVALGAMFYIGKSFSTMNSPLFRKFALHTELEGDATTSNVLSETKQSLVGCEGVVVTDLHPIGKVSINGAYFQATSISGMLTKGDRVLVKDKSMGQLVVQKIKDKNS